MDAVSSVSADLVPVALCAPRSHPPPAHPRRATRAGQPPGRPVRRFVQLIPFYISLTVMVDGVAPLVKKSALTNCEFVAVRAIVYKNTPIASF